MCRSLVQMLASHLYDGVPLAQQHGLGLSSANFPRSTYEASMVYPSEKFHRKLFTSAARRSGVTSSACRPEAPGRWRQSSVTCYEVLGIAAVGGCSGTLSRCWLSRP